MSSPDLDTDQWYYIYVGNSDANALWGTNLYNNQGTSGAIFLNTTQTSLNTMRWQIYPINSTAYVIRSKEGGANAFVGTHYVPAEESEGHTRPRMVRGDIANDSVFWQFSAWGDDTWWLTNVQNGSDWHLNLKQNGLLTMSNNISAPQNGQRWSFGSIAKIDDKAYSSVALRQVTVTSPGASALPSPTSSSSTLATSSMLSSTASALSTTTPTPSSGLSTGGKIGLGVALGVAALIALGVLGLFYRRKRNQKRASKPQELAYEPYQGQGTAPALPERREEHYKHELYHDSGAAKYEMPSQTVAEVDARGQERQAELMGDTERR
ncbi:hypothetical protein E8E12_004819 [Didymella heteroderae]|uniref:Uncharacterized protein n=1 Tax=Didymella heteroderae TaxID=1769908 RepID=A0A9P4WNC5_9PLEO|nr:hypothetical protein E8E12_004819 [Didymella heteroderae]